MILIVDNSKRKVKEKVLNMLFDRSVPTVITDSEHCADYMPAEFIIVTEKYLYEDVVFSANMFKNQKIILADESVTLDKFIENIWDSLFEDRFNNYRNKHIGIFDGEIYFAGGSISLSKTERRILNMLMYTGNTYSIEMIANYCLGENVTAPERSVRVHISNINNKSILTSNRKIIINKRNVGFKINADLNEW